MKEEYKDLAHHIIGALKGCAIGTVVSLVSAFFVLIMGLF